VKPPPSLIDYWVLVGAAVASVTTPFLRSPRPNDLWRFGMENAAVRVLAIWLVAVAAQAIAWRIWTMLRR
jgi:hypothetical protein